MSYVTIDTEAVSIDIDEEVRRKWEEYIEAATKHVELGLDYNTGKEARDAMVRHQEAARIAGVIRNSIVRNRVVDLPKEENS
jgi:DNA helicase TIP49 (TBP-interacting protein)